MFLMVAPLRWIAARSRDCTAGYWVEVASTQYPAVQSLDLAAIQRNGATIRNIRLWDPRPLLNTNEQLQAIRQYYKFNDVGVDRYVVNGDFRQMMISAREMVQAQLPAAARTWVNNTLVYTHGFCAVMNPGNDVTLEGNPNYLVSDIPPKGPTNLQIAQPQIYFCLLYTSPSPRD